MEALSQLLRNEYFWLWLLGMAAMVAVAWKDRTLRWVLLLGAAATVVAYVLTA